MTSASCVKIVSWQACCQPGIHFASSLAVARCREKGTLQTRAPNGHLCKVWYTKDREQSKDVGPTQTEKVCGRDRIGSGPDPLDL